MRMIAAVSLESDIGAGEDVFAAMKRIIDK